jgi:NAD(P)-dependent dehydrogenase (short-subunit alcohol dehydrogenase family)
VLVNNAGVSTLGMRFDEVGPELWERVVDINLTEVYNGVRQFLPEMREAGVSVLCPGGVRTRLWRTSRPVCGLPDTDIPPL